MDRRPRRQTSLKSYREEDDDSGTTERLQASELQISGRDMRKRKRIDSPSREEVGIHKAIRAGLRNSLGSSSPSAEAHQSWTSPPISPQQPNPCPNEKQSPTRVSGDSHVVTLRLRGHNATTLSAEDESDEPITIGTVKKRLRRRQGPSVDYAVDEEESLSDASMSDQLFVRNGHTNSVYSQQGNSSDTRTNTNGKTLTSTVDKKADMSQDELDTEDQGRIKVRVPKRRLRRSSVRDSTRRSTRHVPSRLVRGSREEDEEYRESTASISDMSDGMSSDSLLRDDLHTFVVNDELKARRRARHTTRSSRRKKANTLASSRARRSAHLGSEESYTDGPDDLEQELADIRTSDTRQHRKRELRQRTTRPDYAIPPPILDQASESPPPQSRGTGPRTSFRTLYPQMSGLGLGLSVDNFQLFGNHGTLKNLRSDTDSSDDEGQIDKGTRDINNTSSLTKPASPGQTNVLTSNTSTRTKGATFADADPVAVDQTLSFEAVGGLDDHINQLKEMISLPLLYPEIFQKFHITPPRGVLFHGPPGTGKTLMARALAASCSASGRKVSFYMRKGADCLSKWVGEAERQLRLLFEEAKNNQPSIIFFDEIDGLAPVRSAKQDQIHASIVSTLLALMDGMDSRGEIIIIGATNRPDSIDPALRRPGRFDREFYFPLPALNARQSILKINTCKWDPPPSATLLADLASKTKGYGGADLRALCTEAALIAVQRRYPQIYASAAKLVIDPQSIDVLPQDFTSAMHKLIPSSARSVSNSAAPLPRYLEPLLARAVKQVTTMLDAIIPQSLEKCHEDSLTHERLHVVSENGSSNLHALSSLRFHKPRILISAPPGYGQTYIGAAILHHLDKVHVQTIDLISIFGDSSSTPEASLIRLFVETKRRRPAVLYLPDIEFLFGSMSDSLRSTFLALMSTIDSGNSIIVIALSGQPIESLDSELVGLFKVGNLGNVELTAPDSQSRAEFFAFLMAVIAQGPVQAPAHSEGRRELEVLPLAPPQTPHVPSKLEKKDIEIKDRKTQLMLKAKLSPLLDLIRTRYKRFKKPMIDDKDLVHLVESQALDTLGHSNYQKASNGMILEVSTGKTFNNMDLNLIEERLWNNLYLTPKQFQLDIEQIVQDVQTAGGDRERYLKVQEMHTVVLVHLDEMFDANLREECKRMALREVERHKRVAEQLNQRLTSGLQPCVTSSLASVENTDVRVDDTDKSALENIIDQPHEIRSPRHETALQPVNGTFLADNLHELQKVATLPGRESLQQISEQSVAHSDSSLRLANEGNAHEQSQLSNIERTTEESVNALTSPIHLPIKFDRTRLPQIQASWVQLTRDLNVEQLEAVHAEAARIAWEHRADWDRDRVADAVNVALRKAIETHRQKISAVDP